MGGERGVVGNIAVYIYRLEHVVKTLRWQGMYRTSARKREDGRELGVVQHKVFFIALVWLAMCIL